MTDTSEQRLNSIELQRRYLANRASEAGSHVEALLSRMSEVEGAHALHLSRITSLEEWRDNKHAPLGAAISGDLNEAINPIGALVGGVVNALNATNAKINNLCNRIAAHEAMFQERGLTL